MPKRDRLSALDLVESLQLAHAVAALQSLGIVDELPATAAELARKHRLDERMLRGTLDYLAARSDLIRRRGETFHATRNYTRESRFLIELYGLAYAPNAARLAELLRNPKRARDAASAVHLARAFEGARGMSPLAQVARRMQLNHVLDLGCGSGALLRELARDEQFIGWGLDANPAMCTAARRELRGTNVRILHGEARHVLRDVPANVRKAVRALTASQVANEMFGHGERDAVRWLRSLRRAFPGRPLLLSDYYGRLGHGAFQRETWLHDFAQLLSGQGIPPATFKGWNAVYEQSGYRLAHVIEDTQTTLFVHLLL